MKEIIYVVWANKGEWSDAQYRIVCATTDKDKADRVAKAGNSLWEAYLAQSNRRYVNVEDFWNYRVVVADDTETAMEREFP